MNPDEVPFERPDCSTPDGSQLFFPAGALFPPDPESEIDPFLREWFSSALVRLGEPSLSCGQSTDETYRLLMLPSWGPPLAIRVTMAEPYTMTATTWDGRGHETAGTHLEQATKSLTGSERRKVIDAIAESSFWSEPTLELDRAVYDGAEWIFEVRSGRRYHVVYRTSPESGAFRKLSLAVMDVAGVHAR